MLITLEHIGLAARDTGVLADWYQRVLGAWPILISGEQPPTFFLELPGETLIEIYSAKSRLSETSQNSLAGWRHLALRVESIEAARDLLASRGVTFPEPIKPAGGGGRVLFFSDPEGNLLHLVERPPDSIFRRGNAHCDPTNSERAAGTTKYAK